MGSKQEELEVLKDRVRTGNKKLQIAWDQICKLDHESEQWNKEFQKWHEANEKLSVLCTQLKVRGFTDCLHLDDKGEKIKKCLDHPLGCLCCPSATPYWTAELFASGREM